MAIGNDGDHKSSEKVHSTTHPLLESDSGSGHFHHEGSKKGFSSKYKIDFTKEEIFSAVLEVYSIYRSVCVEPIKLIFWYLQVRKQSILRSLITDDANNASGITSRIRELLKAAQTTLIAEKKVS